MASHVKQNFSIKLGDKQIATKIKCGMAIQTSYIAVPSDHMKVIVDIVSAVYDELLLRYEGESQAPNMNPCRHVVDCAEVEKLPDMTFIIGALQYHLPSKSYARKV